MRPMIRRWDGAWETGGSTPSPHGDGEEAEMLYRLLEDTVVPLL